MLAKIRFEVDQAFIERYIMPSLVDKVKPYYVKNDFLASSKDKKNRPEYYEGYNQICDMYDEAKVHTDMNMFPAKLLGTMAPNMTEQEFKYRKEVYQPVTVPVYVDFVNSISRCWNDNNWAINYPDEKEDPKFSGDNSLRKFIETGIELSGSLEDYFRYFLTPLRLVDPNGGIAIRPKDLYIKPLEGNKGYDFSEDDTKPRTPQPIYFDCTRVLNPDHEDYVILHSHEKSDVYLADDKLTNQGLIFEVYTAKSIYAIIQVGKYNEFTFIVKKLLDHDLGKIPFHLNKGIPHLICERVHFVSPFYYAVGNLNLMLLNASNLQLSITNLVYPIRVMLGDECDFKDTTLGVNCADGYINNLANNTRTMCRSCNGSGLKTKLSRVGTILIKPKGSLDSVDIKPSDVIYYASPDTSTLTFLQEKVVDDETRARGILHLYNSTTKVQGGDNTATDSNIDQKANYAFIKPVSDQTFSMLQWAIDIIGQYREGTSYKKITVTAPMSFDFYTEQDYLDQIAQANQSQLPPFVVYTIMWKFLNTLYYTEKETAKRFYLIMAADRLVTLSNNDIQLGQSKGTIANWEILLHQSAINLIQELEFENESFWKQDLPEQVEQLKEAAKLKADEIKAGDPITDAAENALGILNKDEPQEKEPIE